MQLKIFTVTIGAEISNETVLESLLELTLQDSINPQIVHTDLEVTVSNGHLLEESPLSAPRLLRVLQLLSKTIIVKVSGEQNIDDLELIVTDMYPYTRSETAPMEKNYKPLHNMYIGQGNPENDANYTAPFRTKLLNINLHSIIDAELQFSYDSSINIIFSDDKNPIRLVNSRWSLNENGILAILADRRQTKDTNTYSEKAFYRTELIPAYNSIPLVTFNGLLIGGQLPGGGYRYFFRYVTADGAESDICEESRLVEVHKGDKPTNSVGVQSSERTTLYSSFTLTNLDNSFFGIRVYYTVAAGESNAIITAYKINSPFLIRDGKCEIVHNGIEPVTLIEKNSLLITYSDIARAKTIGASNNRLLAANIDLEGLYLEEDAIRAASVEIYENEFDIKHSLDIKGDQNENYANPIFTYEKLGYWKGETYELGVILVSGRAQSVVYPLHGIDNFRGNAVYNQDLLGNLNSEFYEQGENSLGVYRTNDSLAGLWTVDEKDITFKGTHLKAKINYLLQFPEGKVSKQLEYDTGLSIVYDTYRGRYFIDGITSLNASSGVPYLIDMKPELPAPSSSTTLYFSNIDGTASSFLLTTEGTVLSGHAIKAETVLTDQCGTDTIKPAYDGFFFVRRIRKKDKLAQGIMTAAATIPIVSTVHPDSAAAIAGNWTGIGINSPEFNNSVTIVPTPKALMPFGTESFNWEAVKKSGVIDFVVRAPILNYEDMNSWAFYCPDIDCAPQQAATEFDSGKKGVSIRTDVIPTVFEFISKDSLVKNQPIYLKIAGDFEDVNNYQWKFEVDATFVETGSFNPADRSFSAMIDRHLYIWQDKAVNAYPNYTAYIDIAHDANENVFKPDNKIFRSAVLGMYGDEEKLTEKNDTASTSDTLPRIDSWMWEGRAPGNSINYGRYVGIRIPSYEVGLEALNMIPSFTDDSSNYPWNNRKYESSLTTTKMTDDPTQSYGHIVDIYNSVNGTHLTGPAWASKYAGDESSYYTSISRRYSMDEFPTDSQTALFIDLYGGDCYLGQQWKQVWSPRGIPEFPHATEMDPFRIDRRALGLLSYGFAIPIPVQSNYNFNIRTRDKSNATEYNLLKRERSFLPLKKEIRGDKLVETGTFQFGYDVNAIPSAPYYRLNSFSPYIKLLFPNRVYASNPGIESVFWNGFTVFTGLNFKDYNSEHGYISKIVVLNNYTFLIYHHGIAQIGVNERSMVSGDTGGVFTDSVDVLSPKSNVISDKYGSQHLHSVTTSIAYVYGVDAINKKIWRVNPKGVTLLSDLKIQALLTEIIDEMQAAAEHNNGVFDIYTHYDVLKNDISFTFNVKDSFGTPLAARTLIYSETLSVWVTETNDTRNFLFKSNEDRYSFNAMTDLGGLYKYYRGETNPENSYYNKFYGTVYDASIKFNIIDNPGIAKVFENMFIISNDAMPYAANYTIENIKGEKTQTFIPYTNVAYIVPGVEVSGNVDEDFFTLNDPAPILKWTGELLDAGDFLTIGGDYFVCMGQDGDMLYVDRFLTKAYASKALMLGYKNSIRIATASYEDTFTKITIRTLESGSPSKLYTPRGKHTQVELLYEGMAPLFLDKVITSYSTSHS